MPAKLTTPMISASVMICMTRTRWVETRSSIAVPSLCRTHDPARLQRVADDVFPQRAADVQALDVVELPVDAAVDSAHAGFLGGGPDARELARRIGQPVGGRGERNFIGAERMSQHARRRAAEGAVP